MAVRSLAQSSLVEPFNTNSMLAGYSGNAFHHLETVRLSSSAASVTFSNLARYNDFQHLQIRMTAKSGNSSAFGNMRFNGDSASNYSTHVMSGRPPSVLSENDLGTAINWYWFVQGTDAAQIFSAGVWDFLDAFDTSKYKTVRGLVGRPSTTATPEIQLNSGSWRSLAGINEITFTSPGTNIAANSRFSLYGIKARA